MATALGPLLLRALCLTHPKAACGLGGKTHACLAE